MATNLSMSVQEMDSEISSEDHMINKEFRPLCYEDRDRLMEFRPLLEGDGFQFIGDLQPAVGDPHFRAAIQIGRGQRNEDLYRAYRQSVHNSITKFKLEDERESTKEDDTANVVIDPSFQEHGPSKKMNDLQWAIGVPKPRARRQINVGQKLEDIYRGWLSRDTALTDFLLQDKRLSTKEEDMPHLKSSIQEQALKYKEYIPQTTCLMKILLSDGRDVNFEVDDVMHVCHDIASALADLHADSIVYSDMQVGNVYLNNEMRAFLIDSQKSKKQNDEARLVKECAREVKDMCIIMGGMYRFYIRNKPPESRNSNQETERALYDLLKRGSRTSITARDFLEELGRIVAGDEIKEPMKTSQPESRVKKSHGLGQVVGDNSPEPKSGAIDGQSLEPSSRPIDNQVPIPKSGTMDGQGLEPSSRPMDTQVPIPRSGAMDGQGLEPSSRPMDTRVPIPKSRAMDGQGLEPSSRPIDTQVPIPKSGAMDGQGLEPSSRPIDTQVPIPKSGAMDGQGLEPEPRAMDTQGPEKEPGDSAREGLEGLELRSGAMEDHSLEGSFSEQASTAHDELMSDLEMEMFLSASSADNATIL